MSAALVPAADGNDQRGAHQAAERFVEQVLAHRYPSVGAERADEGEGIEDLGVECAGDGRRRFVDGVVVRRYEGVFPATVSRNGAGANGHAGVRLDIKLALENAKAVKGARK